MIPVSTSAAPARALGLASLVAGGAGLLLGWALLGLPSIAAIVLGHLALLREPDARGYAIAGLVLGYLGVVAAAVIALLVVLALLLPFAFLATFPEFTSL